MVHRYIHSNFLKSYSSSVAKHLAKHVLKLLRLLRNLQRRSSSWSRRTFAWSQHVAGALPAECDTSLEWRQRRTCFTCYMCECTRALWSSISCFKECAGTNAIIFIKCHLNTNPFTPNFGRIDLTMQDFIDCLWNGEATRSDAAVPWHTSWVMSHAACPKAWRPRASSDFKTWPRLLNLHP